jgi:hypothetical protein
MEGDKYSVSRLISCPPAFRISVTRAYYPGSSSNSIFYIGVLPRTDESLTIYAI